MNDRIIEITIMTLFSAVGVMILVLGWVRPLEGYERAVITLIGSAGLVGTLIRLLLVRSQRRATVTAVNDSADVGG